MEIGGRVGTGGNRRAQSGSENVESKKRWWERVNDIRTGWLSWRKKTKSGESKMEEGGGGHEHIN